MGREAIFLDDIGRQDFLKTLAGILPQGTGFQAHAYCLISNHFHLILETPESNLVEGMRAPANNLRRPSMPMCRINPM